MSRPLNCLIWNDVSTKINLKSDYPLTESGKLWLDQSFRSTFSNDQGTITCQNLPTFRLPKDRYFSFELQFDPKVSKFDKLFGEEDENILNINDIPPAVLNRVRTKQGFFLIQYITEGFATLKQLSIMCEFFKRYDIPASQVIYISNCGNGSVLLEKLPIDEKYKIRHIYYPSLMEDFCHWIDKDCSPKKDKIKKKFLCYNRNHHPHRLYFYDLMTRADLIKHCYYSMPAEGHQGDFLKAFLIDDASHRFREEMGILDPHPNSIKKLPLVIDDFDLDKKGFVSGTEHHDYQSSLISLVTETYFFNECIHVTEKTYKPLSLGHPFILIASKGTLGHLKRYGFKTFGKFWDESYDLIKDPVPRMKRILHAVNEISKWDKQQQDSFLDRVQPILEHNKNRIKELTETRTNCIQRKYINWQDLK